MPALHRPGRFEEHFGGIGEKLGRMFRTVGVDQRLFPRFDGFAVRVELVFQDFMPAFQGNPAILDVGEGSTSIVIEIVRELVEHHVADLTIIGRFRDVAPGEHDARSVLRLARHHVFELGNHASFVFVRTGDHKLFGVYEHAHEIPVVTRAVDHEQASLSCDHHTHLVGNGQPVAPDESHVGEQAANARLELHSQVRRHAGIHRQGRSKQRAPLGRERLGFCAGHAKAGDRPFERRDRGGARGRGEIIAESKAGVVQDQRAGHA